MVLGNPDPLRHQVHGIVDRDFDDGNADDWAREGCRVLRTPTHEMENLLLDFDVLALVSTKETAEQIRERARAHALHMLLWMVHKAVVRKMQEDLGSAFPGDARLDVLRTLDDVEQHLARQTYWTKHGERWTHWSQPAARIDEARTWHALFQAELEGDGWVATFSGKELFRYLRSHVRGLDDTPRRSPQVTEADRDLDLAKRLARQMREVGKIPPEIARMRAVLREKAGLS